MRTILGELGAGAVAAYLGDDLTDEDAFVAIKGRGLAALVRAEARPTAADIRLRPPDELLAFLRRWHETCLK
jgi:trehalose-6-phosphatase